MRSRGPSSLFCIQEDGTLPTLYVFKSPGETETEHRLLSVTVV